ncbi:phage tail tape measure protein [Mechercharimyces sp. CAU 1602]|uniref:phage tail tape measure protein n=1 Tax=Mechercharimyces sp. CAU 1602 TaxID=2973933 RepID=UPI00216340DE|nr:phage tail tape measure protein [Mechercharimyces sp. CAU 1602]MCS1350325.1 phage tail tape measure protein [Mechercharimyces sp. CAU 1602]
MKRSFGLVEKAALAVGGAVAIGIGGSTAVAATFEQAMSRVKAISGANESQFKKLEDAARQLGETTSFSASEAASGMEYLAMAGFDTTEIIAAMPGVLNLAKSGAIDLGTAADITSNILTGFGMSADQTGHLVDVMASTVSSSNTNIDQLGDAMKYVAPIASQLGWSVEETASAIAAMSSAGIQGSQAGTSLRQSLLSLVNPSQEAKDLMDELEISITGTNGEMKPMPELIGHIANRLEGMTEKQKTSTLAQLVGTEAASGFINVINKGPDALAEYAEGLENSDGAAQKMADTMGDNMLGSFKKFQSALEGLGISIGNEFLPYFTVIVDAATDVVRLFGKLDSGSVAMGLAMAGVASTVALVSTAFLRLRVAVAALYASMGPAGWIIAGISAIAAVMTGYIMQQERQVEVSMEQVQAGLKQTQANDQLIGSFEELKSKSRLTTEEFGRYIDLQEELAQTNSEEKVAEIKEEMEGLREKSGLSNDELNTMVRLNGELIEAFPNAEKAVSEFGNEVVETTDKMWDMNYQQQEMLKMELMQKLSEGAHEYADWMEQIKQKESEMTVLRQQHEGQTSHINDLYVKRKVYQDRLLDGDKENDWYAKQRLDHYDKLIEKAKEERDATFEKVEASKEDVGNLNEKIAKHEIAKQQMADLLLAQNGINIEAGKGLEGIDKEIEKNKDLIQSLKEQKTGHFENDKLLQEQIESYEEQNSILQGIKESINETAGAQLEVNKEINEGTNYARTLNDKLNEETKKPVDTSDIDDGKKKTDELNSKANQKTKKPVDTSDVDKGNQKAANLNKDISKSTKKPMSSKDIESGQGKARDLNKDISRSITKTVKTSSIWDAVSVAKDLHDWLTKPATKAVSVVRSIYENLVRHQGGLIPTYHTGTPSSVVPGIGEVNATLLGGEMVLTQQDQAKLFRWINDMEASFGNVEVSGVSSIGDQEITINLPVILDGRQIGQTSHSFLYNQKTSTLRSKGYMT